MQTKIKLLAETVLRIYSSEQDYKNARTASYHHQDDFTQVKFKDF